SIDRTELFRDQNAIWIRHARQGLKKRPVQQSKFQLPVTAETAYAIDKNKSDLFRSLRIRSIMLRNRKCVSRTCPYSIVYSGLLTGVTTPLFIATIGHNVFKGAALAVSKLLVPLWIYSLARQSVGCAIIACGEEGEYAASVGCAGIGESASALEVDDGCPDHVLGPSGVVENTRMIKVSTNMGMMEFEIKELVFNFAKAAWRAVKAGVDAVEIYAAHGCFINQFLGLVNNRRADHYGGSFENMIHPLIKVIVAIQAVISDTVVERKLKFWTEESILQLARRSPDLDVNLIDVSLGGNHCQAQLNVLDVGDKYGVEDQAGSES
ncbi:hypothetical protein N7490_009505, partial [Penicillium lividum]